MTSTEIKERIDRDEYQGEKLINYLRIILAFIYAAGMPVISAVRNSEGYGHMPLRAHICTSIFFLYALFLFFYLRKKRNFTEYSNISALLLTWQ
ncbi:MAG: hypothetical protein LBB81_05400 [Treponema sp.]|jgi:hypothetical protein|nr:hypothetical protein [Treponema sp.]